MKAYAHIENGDVANIVVAETADDLGADTGIFVEVPAEGPVPGIGWGYTNGAFVPPTPPAVSNRAINATILAELATLDLKRSRPLTDIALGNGDFADPTGKTARQRLGEIEAAAAELRVRLVP